MKASVLRDKLYDYIRVADDKKIKAIYVMLENEIEEEIAWWKDKEFMKDLDSEYADWKSGKVKGYTLEETNASIDQLRIKRNGK